jgi:hypothetical protein
MKTRIFITIVIAAALGFTGCKDHLYDNFGDEYNNSGNGYYDNTPPSAPANVSAFALDSEVEVSWDRSTSSDVAGYNVYYAYEYNGHYTLIGNTKSNVYVDGGSNGPANGVKYFYAVTAYDYNGNESDLSGTYAFAIPRPEGYNISLFDLNVNAAKGGYDFSDYLIVNYTDQYSDLFFEQYDGKYYLDVWEDSDIKDMGATYDITDITIAPVSGYVSQVAGDNIKYAEAIAGHTYVIRTWDNHFAKVRISQIASDRVVFDWAYQLIKDELLLKEGAKQSRTQTFNAIKVKRQ